MKKVIQNIERMYNLFYYKTYGKDRQYEKESVPGSVSLYTANLYRILIFGNVLWIYDAEQRIFFCVSVVDIRFFL